eukprot:TRINITY_DN20_c0_g3_i1.p1 TRINITY_DN20_c0_g3~~TRINITY_DN20_c0_g3_i1.p1  ORF type:complete len:130 (-),score=0.85 TRINITY_DN20_c0_g3_i1:134-469(-)
MEPGTLDVCNMNPFTNYAQLIWMYRAKQPDERQKLEGRRSSGYPVTHSRALLTKCVIIIIFSHKQIVFGEFWTFPLPCCPLFKTTLLLPVRALCSALLSMSSAAMLPIPLA